jgi:predicted nucleic acid-binding protein
MSILDLGNEEAPLPVQIVLDTSLLLACREGDDNPCSKAAKKFIQRLGQQIGEYQMVAWLLCPVLQECYHIILSRSLRRSWAALPSDKRPPNWLAAYKHQPDLLTAGFADMADFDDILAAIPLTPAQPEDLKTARMGYPLEERIRYFISSYYLLPQDALILAEAERLGVTAVATLDHDWHRVKEFDIYTAPV